MAFATEAAGEGVGLSRAACTAAFILAARSVAAGGFGVLGGGAAGEPPRAVGDDEQSVGGETLPRKRLMEESEEAPWLEGEPPAAAE